jgi:hypothetical protein
MRSCTRYLPVAKDGSGRVGSGQTAPRTARPGPVRSGVSARATRFRVANPSRAFIATCALTMACGMTSGRWITRRRGGVAEILIGISPHLARLFITPSLRFNCRQFSLSSHQQQQLVFPVRAPPIQKLYTQASPAPAPPPPASHPFS